jgi:Protein of unknown function (DUF4232)
MTRAYSLLALPLILLTCACGSERSVGSGGAPVPWVNRPQPRYTIPEPKVGRYPTRAPPCRPAQLHVSRGRTAVATGNMLEELVFTNTGARQCLLRGYPTITGETPTGEHRVLRSHGGDTFFGRLVPADLAPGGHAFLDLGTSDCGCRCERPTPTRYRNLVFTLPHGGRVYGGNVSIVVDCFLDIGPFGLPERVEQPQPEPGTPGTLRASVQLPRTARAGTTLRYVITLTNPAAQTVALAPCPAYTEWLGNEGGGVERSFALNCDSVQTIPRHAHVDYEMELDVPAEVLTGTAKVAWRLNTPTGPYTAGVVEITAG